MSREAMQMALDALEAENLQQGSEFACNKAIKALRAALAQPEPEPAAWWGKVFESSQPILVTQLKYQTGCEANKQWIPLYTAPPPRKPMTDEEMFAVFDDWSSKPETTMADLCRTIEAAHGIKENK